MYINKFIFQNKDYQLVFVAYNAKHAELRRKSKDWLGGRAFDAPPLKFEKIRFFGIK
jgi:hypothetical protein